MLSHIAEVPPDVLSLQTVEDVLHLEHQAETFPLFFNPRHLLLSSNFALSLQQLHRNHEVQWNMQSGLNSLYTLRMHEPYILCEGTNSLLELFGKHKIVDYLLVLLHSFLQHYHTSVILKQVLFPKMQHINWIAITSWSWLSLPPFFSLSL